MKNLAIIAMLSLAASLSFAQETQPAAPAAEATTAPATQATTGPETQAAVDPAALKILEELEAAGNKHQTIQADINYIVRDPKLGDEEARTGYVMYQKETDSKPAKFRIHFDTLRQGDGPKTKAVKDYAFDGQWLTIADHINKKMSRIQVAAPGEKIEPLRLGKGPFPLPFGQKVDEVLKFFNVSTREIQANEPAGTEYLKLVPHPKNIKEMNFVELQMWIDPSIDLPIKIISRESNKMVTTVFFSPFAGGKEILINQPIKDENFLLERPAGWKLEITPLEKKDEQ